MYFTIQTAYSTSTRLAQQKLPNNKCQADQPFSFNIFAESCFASAEDDKLGFAEINPGGCGRLLAFIIGIASLIIALFLSIFPVETLEAIVTSLAQQIQQNLPNLTQFKLPS
nr:hypothetical protein [Aerosakkonema funiforme]